MSENIDTAPNSRCICFGLATLILTLVNQGCATGSVDNQMKLVDGTQVSTHTTAKHILRGLFSRLDCDLDGTIEQAEIDDHFAQIWLPADSDASQSLNNREYTLITGALNETQRNQTFATADADASGTVSANELRRYLFNLIELLDDNGDLELSRADLGMKEQL